MHKTILFFSMKTFMENKWKTGNINQDRQAAIHLKSFTNLACWPDSATKNIITIRHQFISEIPITTNNDSFRNFPSLRKFLQGNKREHRQRRSSQRSNDLLRHNLQIHIATNHFQPRFVPAIIPEWDEKKHLDKEEKYHRLITMHPVDHQKSFGTPTMLSMRGIGGGMIRGSKPDEKE